LTAGEAKNVDNAVVLARLFNEASGQKAPSKKHGLFISRPLTPFEVKKGCPSAFGKCVLRYFRRNVVGGSGIKVFKTLLCTCVRA
jgi:hypothetical protein